MTVLLELHHGRNLLQSFNFIFVFISAMLPSLVVSLWWWNALLKLWPATCLQDLNICTLFWLRNAFKVIFFLWPVMCLGIKETHSVGEVKWVLQCMYNYRQKALSEGNSVGTHIIILLTWQASHIHFLQIFGLEDDHRQLASSGDVSQREADITQLLLLWEKRRRCKGENSFNSSY